jgi:hypothetical protein
MSFYTSPAVESWQLRRQLDLSAGDLFTPGFYWIYQLGRLPHAAGENVKTTISNFQFAVPASTGITLNSSYWTPEVGHNFRRLTLNGNPLELSWEKLTTAQIYEVERCQSFEHNNPAGRTINSGLCTTFTMAQPTDDSTRITGSVAYNGLVAGYTYRFRVRARYNSTDFTAWSSEQWITITPPAPVMVAPAATSATSTQLTPIWNDVYGDNGYKLYWKVRSGASCSDDSWNGPIAQALNIETYNHPGLTPGTYYCYKIAAIGPSGSPVTPDSAFSNIVSQMTKPSAPGTITFSNITSSSITLSWPQVTGNSGYQIDRSLDNVIWTNNVGSVGQDVTTWPSSGLSPGTLYYYRVSANSAAGYSATSAVQSTTTTPSAPSITVSAVSATQITVSWPVVYGATSYKLDRKEGGGNYSPLDDIAVAYSQLYCGFPYPTVACPNLSPAVSVYTDDGRSGTTTYCYKMRSWNSSGADSAFSDEKCATTPLLVASQNLAATALDGGFRIRLDWTPIDCTPAACGAPTGYEIERQVKDGNWVLRKTIDDGATLTFTDCIAIDPGKQYRYRVRSLSGTDKSPFSEAAVYAKPYSAVEATACPEN